MTVEAEVAALLGGLLESAGGPDDWRMYAECRGRNQDLFFPTSGETDRFAKNVCRSCPVQEPCLEFAIETKQAFGVWGGLDVEERRKEQKRRRDRENKAEWRRRRRKENAERDRNVAGGLR